VLSPVHDFQHVHKPNPVQSTEKPSKGNLVRKLVPKLEANYQLVEDRCPGAVFLLITYVTHMTHPTCYTRLKSSAVDQGWLIVIWTFQDFYKRRGAALWFFTHLLLHSFSIFCNFSSSLCFSGFTAAERARALALLHLSLSVGTQTAAVPLSFGQC
jgi:hypothetical protein